MTQKEIAIKTIQNLSDSATWADIVDGEVCCVLRGSGMRTLLDFLNRLSQAKIHYDLDQCREDAVVVFVTVPGERWEVEFFADGAVEVEVFRSDGTIQGEEELERLFEQFSD